MIKKIHVSKLDLGMYIHDLNCGWMTHKFMLSRFLLTKEADLRKILEAGIQELYIDNSLGSDAEGLSEAEASALIARQMETSVLGGAQAEPHASFQEELVQAKLIYTEANKVVASMLVDVRLGKLVHLERMEPVVSKIMGSLIRNPGAMLSLNRIKTGDKYTFQHSVSVATLLMVFARALGKDEATLFQIGLGGIVHDIGKMRIPYGILNKPSALTDAEFEIMKSHVNLGLETLSVTPGANPSMMAITAQHHERFDGTGYPNALTGFHISQAGRMAAITDIYDALTSTRVYRSGMEPTLALRKVFEWGEMHLDKELVQKFIQAIGIYPVGSLVRLESNRLALVIDRGANGLLNPVVRIIYDAKHRKPLPPKDLDLGQSGNQDTILGPESGEKFGLKLAEGVWVAGISPGG